MLLPLFLKRLSERSTLSLLDDHCTTATSPSLLSLLLLPHAVASCLSPCGATVDCAMRLATASASSCLPFTLSHSTLSGTTTTVTAATAATGTAVAATSHLHPYAGSTTYASAASATAPAPQNAASRTAYSPLLFGGAVSVRSVTAMIAPPTPTPTQKRHSNSAAYVGASADRMPKRAVTEEEEMKEGRRP